MDHIYRGYRISIKPELDGWSAKFWSVKGGTPLTLSAHATERESDALCLERALSALDKYIAYIETSHRV